MDDTCPICHGPLEQGVVLVKHVDDGKIENSRLRSHYFHSECIAKWRRKNNICPLDRVEICSVYRTPRYIGVDLREDHDLYEIAKSVVGPSVLATIEGIDEVDSEGRTLAFHACSSGNFKLVNNLLKTSDFTIATPKGVTPLMISIINGHSTIALKLLSRRALKHTFGQTDNYGMCAFYYACKHARGSIIIDMLARLIPTKFQVRHALSAYATIIEHNHGSDLSRSLTHYLKP